MVISSRLLKCVIRPQVKSGINADRPQWDMYFTAPVGYGQTDFDAFANVWHSFFDTTATGASSAMGSYFSNTFQQSGSVHECHFYAVPAVRGPLGSPVGSSIFSLSVLATDGLPEELSACVSFRGDYTGLVEFGPGRSTRPRARVRNRIYLGPLATAAKDQDSTTKRTRLSATFRNDCTAAMAQYMKTQMAAAGWTWKVFSPSNWQDYAPVSMWVDDAWDVQRRRGPKAISRTVVAL